MAQKVKVLVTKLDDLNLIPKTFIWEVRTNLHKLSLDLYMHVITHLSVLTNKRRKRVKKKQNNNHLIKLQMGFSTYSS